MRTSCRMIWREFECLLITEFLRASQKERTILGKGIESAREKLRERADNTHLLWKGKYHCSADLLFEWFGLNWTKLVNMHLIQQNQSR